MGKRDELIAKYADDLTNKCKVTPDMALLTKVTIGCGPSIYDNDAQTVAASDKEELDRIKSNFLIKKLGLKDGPRDRKSTRLNSSHLDLSRMPSSA